MTEPQRRQFLKDLLGALAQGAGAVVLASAVPARAEAQAASGENEDIQKRAEELAEAAGAEEEDLLVNFVNRAFRNGYGGGFRNAGFRNGGVGGGFRNGGFRNGYGGGFRNGAFRNW